MIKLSRTLSIAATVLFTAMSSHALADDEVSVTSNPKLIQSAWSCSVPCLATDGTNKVLKSASFGWCGTTTLTPQMIAAAAPICKTVNNTDNVKSVRFDTVSKLTARCSSDTSPCANEGLANIGFTCSAMCDGEPVITNFTVCAGSVKEAWSLAPSVCKNPIAPDYLPYNKVCVADGKKPC